MTDDQVRLEAESERVTAILQRGEDDYVPLAVAAALALHQVLGDTRAVVSRPDYDAGLNIAAAALSRFVPVYTSRDRAAGRVRVTVDLTRSHFARGATELRSAHETLGELSVARSDLLSALPIIKRTGLPFSFATRNA
jgi:hypothetical protein